MAHELEPKLPDGERTTDEGELLTQEWVVEGLVVAVESGKPHYVVTEVISGHKKIYEDYPPLSSPSASYIFSPEKLMNYSYRGLTSKDYYRRVESDHSDLDTLSNENVEVAVGDRIRVTRFSRKVPYIGEHGPRSGFAWTIENSDMVTVLEQNVDVKKEETRVLRRKRYIRKNLAAIYRRLERMQLDERVRLETGLEASINWERWRYTNGSYSHLAEFTYGDGPIEDHFVEVKAKPYVPHDDVPLCGDMRYTQNGKAFLQRDITAGAISQELAVVDEPLVELSAKVWTETAFNPEVENVVVSFVVDGVRYVGTVDVEQSTRSFRNPGHHIEFTEFASTANEYNTVALTDEERDQILTYKSTLDDLLITAMHAGVSARVAKKAIGDASSTDLEYIRPLLHELDLMRQKALQAVQPTIDSIKAKPSDIKFNGVRLLVPLSILDSVRVLVTTRPAGHTD